ncbi:hypothetical protein JCM5350_000913 [Sporobolomyces pararoseus]
MSDSDSDTSASQERLNEATQPPQSSPTTKPTISPSEDTFTHNGVQYRSVGVLCTPELAVQAQKEAEAKIVKVNRFDPLSDDVLKKILSWTIVAETDSQEKAVKEADWTDVGRVSNSKLHVVVEQRLARHAVFRRLSLINRRTYHLVRPEFWRHLDMSAFSRNCYAANTLSTLGRFLSSKPTVSLSILVSKSSDGGTTSSQPATEIVQSSTSSSNSPPPKKRRKKSAIVQTKGNEHLPTFGELVETMVIGSYGSAISYFFDQYQVNLPNLKHLFFPPRINIASVHLLKFVTHSWYSLRTIDHLYFTQNTEDNELRVECVLSLFNAAPNLERFGVSGQFALDELRGKRLAFIWKLNARLKHSPTGCLGIGLKQLYFGNGVEMTVNFLRSLKESCPRLTKFHIASGVKIASDTTPQGQTPFDLAAFASQWSTLTSLTLIGNDTFSTSGTLDTILKVCPSITHLHIRSDHISYNFFATIANELASAALPRAQAPANLSIRQIGSETPASAALVQASKQYRGQETGLKHPLKNLAITCRLGEGGENKGSRLHVHKTCILPFSLLLLSFQARGLEWQHELGGQRDMLNRAALMINLERKKQRDQAKREKEEQEKKNKEAQLEKEKANAVVNGNGKGKGKEVESDVIVVPQIAGEGEAISDIDITFET